jgi:hypothetical protein
VEIRSRILEGRCPQGEETFDIPTLDLRRIGIDINREVEEVGDIRPATTALENVQALDDEDVGAGNDSFGPGNDVIGLVAVDRSDDPLDPRLELRNELDQPFSVITLRKSLPVHEPPFLENPVGMKKPVGGNEIYSGMIGPAAQEALEDPGRGRLPDRHRPCYPDDVRNR